MKNEKAKKRKKREILDRRVGGSWRVTARIFSRSPWRTESAMAMAMLVAISLQLSLRIFRFFAFPLCCLCLPPFPFQMQRADGAEEHSLILSQQARCMRANHADQIIAHRPVVLCQSEGFAKQPLDAIAFGSRTHPPTDADAKASARCFVGHTQHRDRPGILAHLRFKHMFEGVMPAQPLLSGQAITMRHGSSHVAIVADSHAVSEPRCVSTRSCQ